VPLNVIFKAVIAERFIGAAPAAAPMRVGGFFGFSAPLVVTPVGSLVAPKARGVAKKPFKLGLGIIYP